MRSIFTLLFCLIGAPIFGETVGSVEYQLPSAALEWEIANKLQNEKGTTIIYVPKGNSDEFFAAHDNNFPSDIHNPSVLKESITKMYPNMDIDLQVLDKADNSLLYEWSAKQNGEEKIHGWGRIFLTKDRTVILSYQTKNVADLSKTRTSWLSMMKDAHSK